MLAGISKLSKLQTKAIFALIRRDVPADDADLDDRELNHLLLADLLENIKFLRPEQRTAILCGVWDTDVDSPCCINQIAFADSRYCTWTGNKGWLDLTTGDTTENLPCPPLETIAYNLVELKRQARNAIENRSGANAKRKAGSMEEQGYVRVGSPDAVSGQVRDGGAAVGPDDDNAGN
jgi:hypothetical protein